MKPEELAVRLLELDKKKQLSLLNHHPESSDLRLAEQFKKICHEIWTKEPRKIRKIATALEILTEKTEEKEIEAIFYWVSAIAALTKGKLEHAVELLDNSAEIYCSLGKSLNAAETDVSKIYALALLGRYEETFAVGENALKIFENARAELSAAKVEMNLGNIHLRRESYRAAEKLFVSARRRFLRLNETKLVAMCENDLAIIYTALNDFRRAEKFYRAAFSHAEIEQMHVTQAEIEASMGNLALFRGHFDEALKFLENSRQKYASLKMPPQQTIAELEIADVYLELNLTNEAFEIYSRTTKTLANLKLQSEEARARANFGRAAILKHNAAIARRELKKAARLYFAENNLVGAGIVKLNEANLGLSTKNFAKARVRACEAIELLRDSGNVRYQLTAGWLAAEAERELENFAAAKQSLEKIYVAAVKNEQANLAQAAENSLGKLAARQKDLPRAEKHFRRAIEIAENLRAPLPAEEFRIAFFARNLESYEELTRIYLKQNKIAAAFQMIENSRSRSLVETLGEMRQNHSTANEAASKLIKKLENLREELNWFYSRLNFAKAEETKSLQRETRVRERKIADLMRQIHSQNGANANQKIEFDGQKLQNQLGANRVLIEYAIFDGQISAFVVDENKIDFCENLCRIDEILSLLENLNFQFGAARYGAKILGSFADELKKRADFYLQKLYEKLLLPLAEFLRNRDLTVVPARQLHYVPFHALFNGQNYVIENGEVNYAPSATVLQHCLSQPKQKLENALLVAYADERIPLVEREVESLRKILPNAQVLTGDAATFSNFIESAKHFDLLHLACHGEFRVDNPLFSSLHLANGWITVRDICAQKLKADLVVLSACETGLNSIAAGDEILGLARGFLTAGVNSLILSLARVNDEATARLMSIFYEHFQAGKNVAASLRLAQLEFIERRAHPYFWSPYVAIGKW